MRFTVPGPRYRVNGLQRCGSKTDRVPELVGCPNSLTGCGPSGRLKDNLSEIGPFA
jgi:hypothetical protein